MQYHQSTHHPPGTAHSMPYQQSAPYEPDEEYSHSMGPPQAMYALPGSGYPQGMASMGYSGSALPTEGGVYPPPLPGGTDHITDRQLQTSTRLPTTSMVIHFDSITK